MTDDTQAFQRIEQLATDSSIAPGLTAICYRAGGSLPICVTTRNAIGYGRTRRFANTGAAELFFQRAAAEQRDPERGFYDRWEVPDAAEEWLDMLAVERGISRPEASSSTSSSMLSAGSRSSATYFRRALHELDNDTDDNGARTVTMARAHLRAGVDALRRECEALRDEAARDRADSFDDRAAELERRADELDALREQLEGIAR